MIAADAKLLTYEQAAVRCGRTGKPAALAKFIQRRVAAGDLIVTDMGRKARRISEFDLQTYLDRSRGTEKTRNKRRK